MSGPKSGSLAPSTVAAGFLRGTIAAMLSFRGLRNPIRSVPSVVAAKPSILMSRFSKPVAVANGSRRPSKDVEPFKDGGDPATMSVVKSRLRLGLSSPELLKECELIQ